MYGFLGGDGEESRQIHYTMYGLERQSMSIPAEDLKQSGMNFCVFCPNSVGRLLHWWWGGNGRKGNKR